MSPGTENPNYTNRNMKNPLKWWNLLVVILSVSTFMAVCGLGLVALQYRNKITSQKRYCERMDPKATEPGLTPAEHVHSPESVPVMAGFYVDRMVSLSIKDLVLF